MVALAGIAVVNVLLPVIVKEYFPTQVGAMTGLYSVALNLGATTAAAATVPLTHAFGGDWRLGLACWAVVAVLAAPSWLPLLRDRSRRSAGGAGRRRSGSAAARWRGRWRCISACSPPRRT